MIAMFAIFCAVGIPLCIPIVAILTKHQREMVEMQLRLQQGDTGLRAEVEALRHEIHALRDTSTQYDLSFDAALQRLEQRVAYTEQMSGYHPSYNNSTNRNAYSPSHNSISNSNFSNNPVAYNNPPYNNRDTEAPLSTRNNSG